MRLSYENDNWYANETYSSTPLSMVKYKDQ